MYIPPVIKYIYIINLILFRADRGSKNLEYNYLAVCNKCFKTYNKSYTFSKS